MRTLFKNQVVLQIHYFHAVNYSSIALCITGTYAKIGGTLCMEGATFFDYMITHASHNYSGVTPYLCKGSYAAFLAFFFLEARATFLSSCSRLLVIGSLATFNAVLETPLRRFKDCNWSCKASIRASS